MVASEHADKILDSYDTEDDNVVNPHNEPEVTQQEDVETGERQHLESNDEKIINDISNNDQSITGNADNQNPQTISDETKESDNAATSYEEPVTQLQEVSPESHEDNVNITETHSEETKLESHENLNDADSEVPNVPSDKQDDHEIAKTLHDESEVSNVPSETVAELHDEVDASTVPSDLVIDDKKDNPDNSKELHDETDSRVHENGSSEVLETHNEETPEAGEDLENDAATKIQARFRGFQVRNEMANSKNQEFQDSIDESAENSEITSIVDTP